MKYARRDFLEAAGAIVAATGIGCSRQSPTPHRPSAATGVELGVDTLPDYSHDLERYLVRLASEARARRKQAINAITTPQGIHQRQKAVTAEIWKMLGGP